VQGSQADINAALDAAVYQPTADSADLTRQRRHPWINVEAVNRSTQSQSYFLALLARSRRVPYNYWAGFPIHN
jgi:hypothetical protein